MSLHYRYLPDVSGLFNAPIVDADELSQASVQPDFWPLRAGSGHARMPNTVPIVALNPRPDPRVRPAGGYLRWGKRALDVVLASAAMVLSAPVLLILMIALWIESGNPLYSQRRVGRGGRVFRMWKLRTMVQGAEERLDACLKSDPRLLDEWLETQKLKNDPRITPIGRLLRKTSLDELPQIFNVLLGDMSLVGPRPMLPEQMPDYLHPGAYLTLDPGITGLWQVTARNSDSFRLRAELDARYAQRVTFWRDLRILVATIGAVVMATGY